MQRLLPASQRAFFAAVVAIRLLVRTAKVAVTADDDSVPATSADVAATVAVPGPPCERRRVRAALSSSAKLSLPLLDCGFGPLERCDANARPSDGRCHVLLGDAPCIVACVQEQFVSDGTEHVKGRHVHDPLRVSRFGYRWVRFDEAEMLLHLTVPVG